MLDLTPQSGIYEYRIAFCPPAGKAGSAHPAQGEKILNCNKDITDNAGEALEQHEEKHPDTWMKSVVGGIFLLLAVLLLAAIFALKNA